jgi:hypothetical protein
VTKKLIKNCLKVRIVHRQDHCVEVVLDWSETCVPLVGRWDDDAVDLEFARDEGERLWHSGNSSTSGTGCSTGTVGRVLGPPDLLHPASAAE